MKTWFISDYHFGHNKPFIYQPRGFSNIFDHNESLIGVHNSLIHPGDKVYFLGDFCFDNNFDFWLNKLNGKFTFIEGNHDKDFFKYLKTTRSSNVESYNHGFIDIKLGEQPVTLCHYAMHSWNKSHFNAWHLYGHHHSKTDFGGKTLNVSVDNLDNKPICDEELFEYMSSRPDNWDHLSR